MAKGTTNAQGGGGEIGIGYTSLKKVIDSNKLRLGSIINVSFDRSHGIKPIVLIVSNISDTEIAFNVLYYGISSQNNTDNLLAFPYTEYVQKNYYAIIYNFSEQRFALYFYTKEVIAHNSSTSATVSFIQNMSHVEYLNDLTFGTQLCIVRY